MNYTEDNMNEKPLFIIEEKPDVIEGQTEGETPVITIETDNSILKPIRRMPWIIATAITTALLCIGIVCGYKYYRTHIDIGVPVSVTSAQNIEKLQKSVKKQTPEVVMTSDSILGVALNFYEIKGLKAEVTFLEPDTTNTDVFLYSRSADLTSYDPKTNHYLGSLVSNGKEMEADVSRLGYCAMANENIVIGIARNEDVKDYVLEQGGSFFRQFILVSNGVLPSRFHLHGKVERRGLGRIGDKLYYIETRHKETMWDFADALREYGFIDAIYITGGTDYCFYRTADGNAHKIGDDTKYEDKHKGEGLIPWLVFKKK
ncbi:MAG: hypothetical protein KBT34_02515 [Prevotella sp.]|nr:hypothetical protein [Candidatus Prevotella equi]